MNLQALNLLAILAAAAGGALAAAGFAGALPAVPAASGGGVLLVAAAGAFGLSARSRADARRRARGWCAEDGPEVSTPPAVAEPIAGLVRAAAARMAGLAERGRARQAAARRARVDARTLKGEHDVLRSLLESLSDGVVLIEAGERPTFMNGSARRVFSVAGEDELPSSLLDRPIAPALKAALEEGLRGDTRESRRGRDIDCSDQSARLVLRLRFLDVERPEGEEGDASLCVLLSDVTREVELNRMKSNFASSVSHELKTPLASMRAFLEMLIDGDIEGEEEQRDTLQRVLDETERLTRLVMNLLNLSRLEAGITKMERAPISLSELLEHIRDVVTPLAHDKKQTIVFELSEFLPPVTGDRNLVEQAAMNLISNAIKYTPDGGSIRVKASIAGREVALAVSDTGVGIPEKALDLVFEKFTRIENNAGLKATGTGLGLPLAKFVAEAHGGSISVESEVDRGSTFTLKLPTRKGEESSESQLVGLEGISA
ncbi:MAG: ATP-binding protein [Planctomycetota bacterium JB042]